MSEFVNLGLVESNRRAMAVAVGAGGKEKHEAKAGAQAAGTAGDKV